MLIGMMPERLNTGLLVERVTRFLFWHRLKKKRLRTGDRIRNNSMLTPHNQTPIFGFIVSFKMSVNLLVSLEF